MQPLQTDSYKHQMTISESDDRGPCPSPPTSRNGGGDNVSNGEERRYSVASIDDMPIEEYLVKQMEQAERATTENGETIEGTTPAEEECNNGRPQYVKTIDKMASFGTPQTTALPLSQVNAKKAFRDDAQEASMQQSYNDRCAAASLVIHQDELHGDQQGYGTSSEMAITNSSRMVPGSLSTSSVPATLRLQEQQNLVFNQSRVGAIRVQGVNSRRGRRSVPAVAGSLSSEFDRNDDDDDDAINDNSEQLRVGSVDGEPIIAEATTVAAVVVQQAEMIGEAEQPHRPDNDDAIHNQRSIRSIVDDYETRRQSPPKSDSINRKNRRLYWGMGIGIVLLLVVGAVIAIVMVVSTNQNQDQPTTAKGQTVPTPSPSMFPTVTSSVSPTFAPFDSVTTSFFLYQVRKRTRNFLAFTIYAEPVGVIDLLNQTDRNFTLFAPPSEAMAMLSNEFLAKYASPFWNGHLRSLLLQHILPFTLYTTDLAVSEQRTVQMIDSINSPAVVTRNSFRGVPLLNDTINVPTLNGVVHAVSQLMEPTWFNKSLVEIVGQLSEERGGDLSVFLRLLNATSSSSLWRASLESHRGGPQTLVVPTNDAWLRLFSLSAIERIVSTGANGSVADLGSLMQNHVFVGVNVVCSAWAATTSEFQTSPNGVSVLTWSGNEVRIVREMSGVVLLNGVSQIVVEDQFSDYGVVHLVDRVLVPPGFNASLV